MKSLFLLRLLLSSTVCWFTPTGLIAANGYDPAGAVAYPLGLTLQDAAPGKAPANLLGAWEFRGEGWSLDRVFHEDGSVSPLGENAKALGKWRLEKDRIVVEYDKGGGTHILFLPLNPAGTRGRSGHGKDMIATKRP